jgi:hypothetical protein
MANEATAKMKSRTPVEAPRVRAVEDSIGSSILGIWTNPSSVAVSEIVRKRFVIPNVVYLFCPGFAASLVLAPVPKCVSERLRDASHVSLFSVTLVAGVLECRAVT